jgi:uncharacterized membrane protein YdcZ (DUF606 family)
MTLQNEITLFDLGVGTLLTVSLWAIAVFAGRFLLHRKSDSLEDLAVAGAWGLAFIVATIATVKSNGTSILLIVPVSQLLLSVHIRSRGRHQNEPKDIEKIHGPNGE